jgi:hypothetical protein
MIIHSLAFTNSEIIFLTEGRLVFYMECNYDKTRKEQITIYPLHSTTNNMLSSHIIHMACCGSRSKHSICKIKQKLHHICLNQLDISFRLFFSTCNVLCLCHQKEKKKQSCCLNSYKSNYLQITEVIPYHMHMPLMDYSRYARWCLHRHTMLFLLPDGFLSGFI